MHSPPTHERQTKDAPSDTNHKAKSATPTTAATTTTTATNRAKQKKSCKGTPTPTHKKQKRHAHWSDGSHVAAKTRRRQTADKKAREGGEEGGGRREGWTTTKPTNQTCQQNKNKRGTGKHGNIRHRTMSAEDRCTLASRRWAGGSGWAERGERSDAYSTRNAHKPVQRAKGEREW